MNGSPQPPTAWLSKRDCCFSLVSPPRVLSREGCTHGIQLFAWPDCHRRLYRHTGAAQYLWDAR